MKKALVLGGGGFIGSHLARRLLAQGFWVRCVDLQRPRFSASAANEFFIADLRDPQMCDRALAGQFDEVYQLAGDMVAPGLTSSGESAAVVARNSAFINLNVAKSCTSAGVKTIFYASSAGLDADPSDGARAWERRFSEQLYLSWGRTCGIPTRIARLQNIFGVEAAWNDQRAQLPAVLCRRIATAEPGSDMEIWDESLKPRSFLHIDECLDAVERLMRSDCAEPVDLESYPATSKQLARMIMDVAGKALSIQHPTRWLGTARGASDSPWERRNLPLKDGLHSTYQWIKAQVESSAPGEVAGGKAVVPSRTIRKQTQSSEHGRGRIPEADRCTDGTRRPSAPETCLREGIRHAIRGRELIDWPDTAFASFLDQFDVIHVEDASQMKDGAIYVSDLASMVQWHSRRRTSHVLITPLDENWGAFSSQVPRRTYPQGDWDERVSAGGCAPEAVRRYLDDTAVKAVVATQHTAFLHPTILSIPIGIHNPQTLLDHLDHATAEKTEDLLINNNAWVGGDREGINDRVIANFEGRLRNTYGLSQPDFYEAVVRSRFVLCPSGMGLDTHRLWETLILGSIPIVEQCAGWDSVLDDLPALLVSDFDEVTPELLARAYPEILAHSESWDYRKLTKEWWARGIQSLLNVV